MKELLKSFLKLVLLSILFSCSVSAPVVNNSKWDITVIKDPLTKDIHEELSIFVNCYDDDGDDDIDTIFFISNDSGIYWELNRDNWESYTAGNNIWIGSNSLVMPDRSPIPRTEIEVFLRDLAGENTEDKIYITTPEIDYENLVFPEFELEERTLKLTNIPKATVKIYSTKGGFINKFTIEKEYKIEDNIKLSDVDIYGFVKSKGVTLKSGPWF